jgi:hypothetical protein
MILAVGLFVFLLGGSAVSLYINGENQNMAISETKQDLQIRDYTVVNGEMNSPTVIEITDNYAYFLGATKNDTRIYLIDDKQFVAIFNVSYGLSYTPEYESHILWGILF